METLYLLDAYALIYRAYYALIRAPRINSKGFNTSAIYGFVNTIEEIRSKSKPDHLAVVFDPSGPTFRHALFPDYKAQREATPEDIRSSVPILKDIIRAYRIPILEVAGYEADDVIGTVAKRARAEGYEVRMITPDKDYAQLVEPHLYMQKPGKGGTPWELMGVEDVLKKYGFERPTQMIDYLALVGDTADNIPGCPGVGPKTASSLIQTFDSIENLLAHTDQLKGAQKTKVETNAEQIKFSKFLATIKTDVPLPDDFSIEGLRTTSPDENALTTLFNELEFRTLLQRVFPKSAATSPKQAPEWPSLFASLTTNDKEEAEKGEFYTLKTVNKNFQLIDNEEEIKQLVEKLFTFPILSLDTETTSTDPLRANLLGVSLSVAENEAFYIPFNHLDASQVRHRLSLLVPLFENENSLKVGQNLKYDLLVLSNYGVGVCGQLFDTMLAHYVLQPEQPHNMDALAETYLHYRTIHIEELIGQRGKNQKSMADLSASQVYEYACEDAEVTLRLYHKLKDELAKSPKLWQLFSTIEMPLLPVLMRMERVGVRLDTETLAQTGRDFNLRLERIEAAIYKLAGRAFTISSPKQVGEVLFDDLQLDPKAKKTKSGQYSTSEEVLQKLAPKHEIVQLILDYRGLKKLLTTYVDALPQLINPATGHIHSSFNQAVTATGRLSSSNPNLQNIPVRGEDGREIRKAFIPEPGELFLSADYSQIELRIMAHLSGDKNLISAFEMGQDIHAATAMRIFQHATIEEVTRDERRKAKTANFGIIYGISVFGLAERMHVSRGEAKELIDSYFATYPGVKQYMTKSVETAQNQGYIETIDGRLRYLPDINSKNAVVRGFAERNAVNAPIQGTAADIIKRAMIGIDKRLQAAHTKAKMILQVHDELNFSVPPDELDLVKQIVREEMENAIQLSVRLEAEIGEGTNWLEAH